MLLSPKNMYYGLLYSMRIFVICYNLIGASLSVAPLSVVGLVLGLGLS